MVYQLFQEKGGYAAENSENLSNHFQKFIKLQEDGKWDTRKYGDPARLFPPPIPPPPPPAAGLYHFPQNPYHFPQNPYPIPVYPSVNPNSYQTYSAQPIYQTSSAHPVHPGGPSSSSQTFPSSSQTFRSQTLPTFSQTFSSETLPTEKRVPTLTEEVLRAHISFDEIQKNCDHFIKDLVTNEDSLTNEEIMYFYKLLRSEDPGPLIGLYYAEDRLMYLRQMMSHQFD